MGAHKDGTTRDRMARQKKKSTSGDGCDPTTAYIEMMEYGASEPGGSSSSGTPSSSSLRQNHPPTSSCNNTSNAKGLSSDNPREDADSSPSGGNYCILATASFIVWINFTIATTNCWFGNDEGDSNNSTTSCACDPSYADYYVLATLGLLGLTCCRSGILVICFYFSFLIGIGATSSRRSNSNDDDDDGWDQNDSASCTAAATAVQDRQRRAAEWMFAVHFLWMFVLCCFPSSTRKGKGEVEADESAEGDSK